MRLSVLSIMNKFNGMTTYSIFSDWYNMLHIPCMYVSSIRTTHLRGRPRWMTLTNSSHGSFDTFESESARAAPMLTGGQGHASSQSFPSAALKMISAPVLRSRQYIFLSHRLEILINKPRAVEKYLLKCSWGLPEVDILGSPLSKF